jgi:hypothetical protein
VHFIHRQVTELQDLFLEEQVFIAFGNDKCCADDLKISDIGMYVCMHVCIYVCHGISIKNNSVLLTAEQIINLWGMLDSAIKTLLIEILS